MERVEVTYSAVNILASSPGSLLKNGGRRASGINGVINLQIFGGLVLNMRGSDCCVDRRGGT